MVPDRPLERKFALRHWTLAEGLEAVSEGTMLELGRP